MQQAFHCCRVRLLSACAYNTMLQGNMRLTKRCAYTDVWPRPYLTRWLVARTTNGQQSFQHSVKGECDTWSPRVQECLDSTNRSFFLPGKKRLIITTGRSWKNQTVVGHMPRESSKIFWHFLNDGCSISCELTGKRKYDKGLDVPCVCKFLSSEKMITWGTSLSRILIVTHVPWLSLKFF